MLSSALRRVGKIHVGAWVLLSLAASSTTLSQPTGDQQKIAELLQRIQDIEAREGPNSEQLIDPLTTLGRLQQEAGQPLQSATAIQRAVEVAHVNQGLHSLDQAPLIRLLIDDAEAIGDARAAWDLEQGLLSLASRHPDDVRTARILRETADRRLAVLDRYIAGKKFPPEIKFGCYYWEPANQNCGAGRSDVAQSNLFREAQDLYSQAARVLLRNEHYPADDLETLVEDLAQKTYRYCPRTVADPPSATARETVIIQCNLAPARRGLVSLAQWQIGNARAWPDGVETLVEIADWDLLYARSEKVLEDKALEEYARVYELLAEQGAQESIDRIFAPETPVIVPAFAQSPLVRGPEQRGDGYIDVSFEIDKYGKSHRIRILGTTTGSTRTVEKRVAQFISGSRFRPRIVDGRFADSTPVVVRYFLE